MMGIMGIPASNLVLFTVTRTFAGMVRQVSTASTNPFASEMGHLWVQNRINALRDTIRACLVIVGGGAGTLIGYFLVFQNSLILIWTQGKVTPDPVIFYLLFANLAFAVPSITTFTVLMYTDHPREITVFRLRHILALCILSVVLGLPFGARGISLAILLSEALLVSVPMVTTLHRNFGMDWTGLLGASVGACAAGVLVAIAAGELAISIYRPTDLVSLAFTSLTWLPLPAALLLGLFWLVTRAKDANRQEQNRA
jgi:O-antigen/teichoic acid export membrane protein